MTASEHTELPDFDQLSLEQRAKQTIGNPVSNLDHHVRDVEALLGEALDLLAARPLPDGAEPVPVAWRPVADEPVAISVLARFFDDEMGEWVYTVFDPGPVKLAMAGPYSEWLPLDTFNRPIFASPTGMGVTEGWQPIETAPLDGTMVHLWNAAHDQQVIAGWTDADSLGLDEGAWTNAGATNQGVHWMYNPHYFQCWRPIPAPPAASEKGR